MNDLSDAIKRPGALTAAVGGPPSEHLDKVRQLAENGTPQERKEALYYLNVLRPAADSAAASQHHPHKEAAQSPRTRGG